MVAKDKKKMPLRTIELFAGVGGFRLGLEGKPNSRKKKDFEVVWSNQYEPSTKSQHAAMVYRKQWGKNSLDNRDINIVLDNLFDEIPEHDVLTGGFPCQDYSVARPLTQAAGLQGKKGVLWWCIYEIIRRQEKKKPKYLILENVDRLLKSPADQRGRDFAIMLSSLAEQGYAVEWRVINAADYGFPQRRRRVFIVGYHKSTSVYKRIEKHWEELSWQMNKGILAKAFPVVNECVCGNKISLEKDPVAISKNFGSSRKEKSPFLNAGLMFEYEVNTVQVSSKYKGKIKTLGDILQLPDEVDSSFYIDEDSIEKWKYQKGAKRASRTSKSGHVYEYAEGGMSFPDSLDKPARTIVTGEGGSTPSRFKHAIKNGSGLRRLTPIELERLNGFPDNHTRHEDVTDSKRAFFMGNALVVGVVERIGKQLVREIEDGKI